MRHKHYDVIVAFAEGKEIQTRDCRGDWETVRQQAFRNEFEYRVKPEVRKLHYRVALFHHRHGRATDWTHTLNDPRQQKDWENQSSFSKWLTDWVEVEIAE